MVMDQILMWYPKNERSWGNHGLGLGGDELFGGYSVFNQIPELQKKKWLMSFPVYGRKPFANLCHAFKGTVASSKIKAILKQEYSVTEFIYQFYRQVMDDQIEKLVKEIFQRIEFSK